MPGKLDGKVALVTGASSGIGKSAAMMFAKEGAKVVVAARSQDKLQAVAEEIKAAGGEAAIAVGDVTKEADCSSMVETALKTFGGLDVAFNNAGAFVASPLADTTEEMIDSMMNVNVKSLVFCLKYQLPAMGKGGGGSIIVNSSGLGTRVPSLPAMTSGGVYAASKAGADMLMKYASIEGAPTGVRVNSVAPGHVETPAYGDTPGAVLEPLTKSTHLHGRPIQPDELSKMVVFLASDDAAMVTGGVYLVDGGWSVRG